MVQHGKLAPTRFFTQTWRLFWTIFDIHFVLANKSNDNNNLTMINNISTAISIWHLPNEKLMPRVIRTIVRIVFLTDTGMVTMLYLFPWEVFRCDGRLLPFLPLAPKEEPVHLYDVFFHRRWSLLKWGRWTCSDCPRKMLESCSLEC